MSEDFQTQINFKIDAALKAELERRAREEHRSMSGHLIFLIERDAQQRPVTLPLPQSPEVKQ